MVGGVQSAQSYRPLRRTSVPLGDQEVDGGVDGLKDGGGRADQEER